MSQVKNRLHPMVRPAWSSMGPAVTCCSQVRPLGTEPVMSAATPTPSSDASRRVSTTKATDHPIAFGRETRLGDGVAVNGDREAEGRGRR